uniref:Uncharacterized protein n=1 Tax=Lepeophtheirus salmonis TaxID=72036 RepID=A0A0K2UR68_LEPSM
MENFQDSVNTGGLKMASDLLYLTMLQSSQHYNMIFSATKTRQI